MKASLSIQQVIELADRHARAKVDIVAPTADISVFPSARTGSSPIDVQLNGETFGVTSHALRQFGTWAKIPSAYVDRMAEQDAPLLAYNLQRWLERGEGRRLVRTIDGNIRAFLSDRYAPADNLDVIRTALPAIQAVHPAVEFVSADLDVNRLLLKIVFPRTTQALVRAGNQFITNREGQYGLVLKNNEVGNGSISLFPLIYDLVCLNGLVYETLGHSRTHIGSRLQSGIQYADDTRELDDKAIIAELRDTVLHVLSEQQQARAFALIRDAADGEPAKNPAPALEVLGAKVGLSEEERAGLLNAFLQEPIPLNRFGAQAAVTRFAQSDRVSYDRATELESIGGRIIQLADDQWEEIRQAA